MQPPERHKEIESWWQRGARQISSAPSPGGEGRDEGEQLFAPLSAVALAKGEKTPQFKSVRRNLTHTPSQMFTRRRRGAERRPDEFIPKIAKETERQINNHAKEVVPQRRRRDLSVETIFPKEFLAP
jgi:hypothetical protein